MATNARHRNQSPSNAKLGGVTANYKLRPPDQRLADFDPARIRDVHYRIARLCAEGKTSSYIAAAVGMSIARISELRQAPNFQPFIARYRDRLDTIEDEVWAETKAKEQLLLHNALEHLNNRYLDSPESITHEQARLDYATVSERHEAKAPTVSYQLHGNVSQIPLAELVTLQRKRADQLLLEAPSDASLTDGASASGTPAKSGPDAAESVPVPTPPPPQRP
jgi:hypothetical protein